DEPAAGRPGGEEPPPAPVREQALDEVLAQPRVAQAPLVLDREQRQPLHEDARERADAGPPRRAPHPHALHAAARRVLLEHVAVEVEPRQLVGAPPGEARHRLGVVAPAARCEETRRARVALEPDRLARDAETELHLGAHRHPLDPAPERVDEERVALVPAVVAHLAPEEAGADADAEPL